MKPLDHAWGVSPAADRVWAEVCGLRPSEAEGRLFMVLRAYFDESYSSDGMYVVAGYIAPVERWAAFAAEWEVLLPTTYPGKDGRHRFKMSEMARRMDRVPAFHKVITDNLPVSVCMALDARTLKTAMKRIWSDNTTILWTPVNNPDVFIIGLLVNLLFEGVSGNNEVIQRLGGEEQIDIYFDDHSRQSWIEDEWVATLNYLSPKARSFVGEGPVFER
jgi:hypothetical protein